MKMMKIKIYFLLFLSLGIPMEICAQTHKTNSLELVNDSLKVVLDRTFDPSQEGRIIFIKINKEKNGEYELKISCAGWVLLKYEYNNNELLGFFKYKNSIGIVYGEKKNIFFKKTGKMKIPDYYLGIIEELEKSPAPIDPNVPPVRYDGSVFYYKYKNGQLTFDRSDWANIWGESFKQPIQE